MSKKEEDRDRVQHQMESAEELYQNAPCGYASFSNDGKIFNINKTLLTWLGYNRKEVVGKMRFQQLFKVGGQIYFETHFFPLIKMQGFVNEINFDILRKDRSVFPGLLNVTEVAAKGPAEKTYRASIFNISDRKNYERELIHERKKAEEASKAKAAFLSMISHEIRTPLNAILGIGNLFHKTPLNPQQEEYARILLNSSENLMGLVNNLLDMSKIEAHKVKIEKLPFSLADLIEVLVSTFQVKCEEKKIELKVAFSDDLPEHLIGDPYKLNQILTNLLGNAIKFTEKGYVKLGINVLNRWEDEVALRFIVSDTGIGIPAEKQEAVFKEFSQASYSVGLKFGGTGLGLTISQRLLQLHGSEMKLESQKGKGSCFSFDIKYELDRNATRIEKKEYKKREEQQIGPAHILVVDDNPLNIFIINEYLAGWNLTHEAVESGKETLEIMQRTHFDLVLMDLHMPAMNGQETARAIRELPLAEQPIIIALSASATGAISQELERDGFDDHVPKPFSPSELFEKLSYHLDHRDTNRNPLEEETKSAPPSIQLARFRKMGKGDEEFLANAVVSTLDAFTQYQQDLQSIFAERDPEALAATIHKMSMSLYYVQADKLSALLKEYRELLEQPHTDPRILALQETSINREFDKVIREIKANMKL